MQKQQWDITCTKRNFEKIKSDDDFLGLLSLGRFVNALRFCQKAAIDSKGDRNPSNARSIINSFLFSSSVLYEGFLLVEKLSQYYDKLDSFENGFGKLLREKHVQALRNSVLKRARNKFVFHFDKDVAKESLGNFDVPVINFASGVGKSTGEMYFGLADQLSINYLLQPRQNESDDSLRKRYIQIVKDTTWIMGIFSKSAEILMADVLEKKGFILKPK
jgi:hypothetical protein